VTSDFQEPQPTATPRPYGHLDRAGLKNFPKIKGKSAASDWPGYRGYIMQLVANAQDMIEAATSADDVVLRKFASVSAEELFTPLSFNYLSSAFMNELPAGYSPQGVVKLSGDQAHAGFDQSARQKQTLAPGGHTTAIGSRRAEFGHQSITLTQRLRLGFQIKRLARFPPSNKIPGFLMKAICRFELPAVINLFAQVVK